MRDLHMAERHRQFGNVVVEVPGWQTRGGEFTDIVGSGNHHDGSNPSSGPKGALGIIINGRGGPLPVPGPLANGLLGRDAVVNVVAAGKANHGGVGSYHGRSGNSHFPGLEIAYAGVLHPMEPFPYHNFDAAARWHAAFGYAFGYDADEVWQHYQYAEFANGAKGRKVDLLREALALHGGEAAFRNLVQHYIDHPPFKATPVPEVDYRLDRILGVGDRDTASNRIIFRCEQLLTWNAVKHGFPGHRPGKIDGVFTSATAESVNAFRHWWWENIDLPRPAAERHFGGPDGLTIGRKVYDALVFAAVI